MEKFKNLLLLLLTFLIYSCITPKYLKSPEGKLREIKSIAFSKDTCRARIEFKLYHNPKVTQDLWFAVPCECVPGDAIRIKLN